MFDVSGIYTEELPQFLNVSTQAGAESIRHTMTKWSADLQTLNVRSKKARILKSALRSETALRPLFEEFAAVEPIVHEFLNVQSELEDESYSQIFFKHSGLKFLNHVPSFIAVLTIFKKVIMPAMLAIMPLLTIIVPYIVIKYVMAVPITISQYFDIVKNMYLSGVTGNAGPAGDGGFTTRIKLLFQAGMFIFGTIQSTYQPILGAIHLNAIDKTIKERGATLVRALEIYSEIRDCLERRGIRTMHIHIPSEIMQDHRRLVAFFMESPFYAKQLLDWIGAWDVAVGFAQCDACTHVTWCKRDIDSNSPHIFIRNTCDTRICRKKQKPFDIYVGAIYGGKDILLTGPNRGGKSTILRALLRSVLLAHTYGVTIGDECKMTPLDWVKTSLRMEDLPGTESLFEREVSFAKDTLAARPGSYGLVCIDELFHSTNPPDAEKTSRAYLEALWKRQHTLSIISTHIFQIVRDAPDKVKKLCCPAEELEDGSISYKYGLEEGICRVSSVNEIIGGAFDN